VVTGLQDDEIVGTDKVDKAMLVGYTTRPGAGDAVPQPLRLAYALSRIAQCIVDQTIDPLEDVSIMGLPELVIFPALRLED
jgi:hypothetical protein